MPNERYVKISMRDRWGKVPLDESGDPAFALLGREPKEETDAPFIFVPTIRDVFTDEEIVHLVNRALYVMKYQKETHANRRRKK